MNDPGHRSNFMQRWLSRSFNVSNNRGRSDTESSAARIVSPPPLTNSSSASTSSSEIRTPQDSPVHFTRKRTTSRPAIAKTPHTPPTKHTELQQTQAVRKPAVSLPPASQPPGALIIRPRLKLHHLLSYYPTRRPLIFDISSPTSYVKKLSPKTTGDQHPNASCHALVPHYAPFPHQSSRYPLPHSHTLAPQTMPLADNDLFQFATTPPVTRMHIICDAMPWSIHVHGQNEIQNDPMSYVRVVDVLDSIYRSLRTTVTESEWERTPKLHRDRVKRAYFERCRRSRAYSLNGYEEKQGVRRVDWFLEKTMFLGLTVMNHEGGGNSRGSRGGQNGRETLITWALMVEPR